MIQISTENGVATILFDNQPHGYLDLPHVQQLTEVLAQIESDPGIRVVILTGSLPDVFIRHYDVKEEAEVAVRLKRSSKTDEEIGRITAGDNPVSQCFASLERLSRPTIAAINGYCQGGGLELALCCDFRIAAAGDYVIGLPEVHLGVVPGGGGTYRLPRLIGRAPAIDLILRGRALTPMEALRAGLVNEVAADALERAVALAEELKAVPAAALASAKSLVNSFSDGDAEVALARERTAFALLLRNDPAAEHLCEAFNAYGGDINDFIAHHHKISE